MDDRTAIERAIRTAGAEARLDCPTAALEVERHACLVAGRPVPAGVVRKRLDAISGYAERLRLLLESPGIPQRTQAWYAAREWMVTGSELSSATNPSSRRAFFERKLAGPGSWNGLKGKPAIQWGVRYEPVACELYRRRTGAKVYEFGLIPHKQIRGFGASPDGITDLGIMLEIKCPYSRVISGDVPRAYYAQIQAQLDTTGLGECDYVECKLDEYADAIEYESDRLPADPSLSSMGMEKGAVWQCEETGAHEVHVGPGGAEWAASRPGTRYWRVAVMNVVRVVREEGFVERLRPDIEAAVAKIAEYRRSPEALDYDYPKDVGSTFPFI